MKDWLCGKAESEGSENHKSTMATNLEGKASSRPNLPTSGKGASLAMIFDGVALYGVVQSLMVHVQLPVVDKDGAWISRGVDNGGVGETLSDFLL